MTLRINSPAYFEQLAKKAEKDGHLSEAARLYICAANASIGIGRTNRYRAKATELILKKESKLKGVK